MAHTAEKRLSNSLRSPSCHQVVLKWCISELAPRCCPFIFQVVPSGLQVVPSYARVLYHQSLCIQYVFSNQESWQLTSVSYTTWSTSRSETTIPSSQSLESNNIVLITCWHSWEHDKFITVKIIGHFANLGCNRCLHYCHHSNALYLFHRVAW